MSQNSASPTGPLQQLPVSRRSFLRFTALGAAGVASVGAVTTLSGCSSQPDSAATGFRFLREGDLKLFAALIPTVIGDLIHTEAHNYQALVVNILQRVDAACAELGNHAQAEVHKLLGLLDMRVTRFLTTGVSAPWHQASSADMVNFLQRWRGSSLGPLNAGYRVLTKLVAVSYYSLPEAQAHAGYAGPWDAMYLVVNA